MTFTPTTYTDSKNSVRAASTGNVTVSSPGATLDGVTLSSRNRVLLKNQTTASQNGIYQWNGAAVPLTRVQDADEGGELSAGTTIYVESGTVNGKKTFTLTTTGAIVIGTTSLLFEELTPTLANSSITDLGDVDTTGSVDGALFRYETTGGQWQDTTNLFLNDAGQLRITTSGVNGGLRIDDIDIYKANTNVLQVSSQVWSSQKFLTTDFFHATPGTATNVAYASRANSDAANRFTMNASGLLSWGDGTAAADVTLARTAANIIALGAGDKIQQNEAPTVGDDLVNKTYVDNEFATFSTTLSGLDDVDITGVVDGSLLRYESTGTQWNDTTALLFTDAGQLQVTTTGAAAGIMLGGDAQLYRGAANILTVGTGDKIQQNAVPTVNDDLTNKLYVDTAVGSVDLASAYRRSWFGV